MRAGASSLTPLSNESGLWGVTIHELTEFRRRVANQQHANWEEDRCDREPGKREPGKREPATPPQALDHRPHHRDEYEATERKARAEDLLPRRRTSR